MEAEAELVLHLVCAVYEPRCHHAADTQPGQVTMQVIVNNIHTVVTTCHGTDKCCVVHRYYWLPTGESLRINFLFQAQSKHSKIAGGHFKPNPGQFVVTSHETLLNKWLNTTTTAAKTTRSTAMRGEHRTSQMQIWFHYSASVLTPQQLIKNMYTNSYSHSN